MTTYINGSIILKILSNFLFGLSMLAGIPSGSTMTSTAVDEQYQTVQLVAGKSVSKQGRRTDFLMDKGFIFRRAKKAERANRQERICLAKTSCEANQKLCPTGPASSWIERMARI